MRGILKGTRFGDQESIGDSVADESANEEILDSGLGSVDVVRNRLEARVRSTACVRANSVEVVVYRA